MGSDDIMNSTADVLCELLKRVSIKGRDEEKRYASRVNINLGEITRHNVCQLKRLNIAVFPLTYNDKFYKEVLTAGNLVRLAYFNDIVVGAVCCRVDTVDGQKRLYIMTLGTLAPYRKYGIGTLLLNHVLDVCKADPQIRSIYLHVQINNESALSFYKRFGFNVTDRVEKYYKNIDPDDAFVLAKHFPFDKPGDAATTEGGAACS